MKVGDSIVFSDSSTPRHFTHVEITQITRHQSFEDMLQTYGTLPVLCSNMPVNEGVAIYRKFYTKENEAQYGVLAIHMRLINTDYSTD